MMPSFRPVMPPVSEISVEKSSSLSSPLEPEPVTAPLAASLTEFVIISPRPEISERPKLPCSASTAVLTFPMLRDASMKPSFRPAMPPVCDFPATLASDLQFEIVAPAWLMPTRPPMSLSPSTEPDTVQPEMLPRFSPARMPTEQAEPFGETAALSVRLITEAPASIERKRPICEPLVLMVKLEIVCEAPSKRP